MNSEILDKPPTFSVKEDPYAAIGQDISKALAPYNLDNLNTQNEINFIDINKPSSKLMLNENGESQSFSDMDNPFSKLSQKDLQSPPPRLHMHNPYSPLTYFPSNMNLSSQYNNHAFQNNKSNHSESLGLTPFRALNKFGDDYYTPYDYDRSNPQPFKDNNAPLEFTEAFNEYPMNLVWAGHDASKTQGQKFIPISEFANNKLCFSTEPGPSITYVNDVDAHSAGFGGDPSKESLSKTQQDPNRILVTKLQPAMGNSSTPVRSKFSASKDLKEVKSNNKSKRSEDFKTTCKSTPMSKGRDEEGFPSEDYEDDPFYDTKQRTAKGLRVLSVKVKDIVNDMKTTSYKEVADNLILDFRRKCKKQDGESKDEQNVKRRVYDALNVLIAADILQREGKKVFCDESIANLGPTKQRKLRADKEALQIQIHEIKRRNRHKRELMQELAFKCMAIKNLTQRNKENIQVVDGLADNESDQTGMKLSQESIEEINEKDNKENINYAKNSEKDGKFISRRSKKAKSKQRESTKSTAETVQATPDKEVLKLPSSEVIKFPFLVLNSADLDNDMNLNMDSTKKQLNIESKSCLQLFGDIDVLLKMGLHTASKESYESVVPIEARKFISKEFTDNIS